eukprot:3370079-Rhodomonas_salina.6
MDSSGLDLQVKFASPRGDFDVAPGTDLAYAAIGLRTCDAMSGTDLPYQERMAWDRSTWPLRVACFMLCVRYALSGTDECKSLLGVEGSAALVGSPICLRACYAMPGTDIQRHALAMGSPVVTEVLFATRLLFRVLGLMQRSVLSADARWD